MNYYPRPRPNARIYFLRPVGMIGPIKIGCSETPDARLLSIASWSPFPLELIFSFPGSLTLERNIHECLSRSQSHREWFHPTDEVLAFVHKLQSGVPVESAIDLTKRAGPLRKKPRDKWPPEKLRYMRNVLQMHAAHRRALKSAPNIRIPSEVRDAVNLSQRCELPPETQAIIDRYVASRAPPSPESHRVAS